MKFLKAFLTLWPLALLGIVSLLAISADRILASLPPQVVEEAGGRPALLSLMLVQPAVLSALAVIVGLLTAHHVGLRSILVDKVRGTPAAAAPASFARTAAFTGLLAGLLLVAGDLLLSPWTDAQLSSLRVPAGDRLPALALGMLYGGLTEEILMRWGVMSLFAWIAFRIGLPRRIAIPLAILLAAALFGAGHLPALAAQMELTTALVVRTLLLNAIGGILFGMAYARHSLEAAMAAHALAHVMLYFGRLLGLAY